MPIPRHESSDHRARWGLAPSRGGRRRAAALVAMAVILAGAPANAEGPPTAAIAARGESMLHPVAPRRPGREAAAARGGSGGWWLGTAGLSLAAAVLAGIGVMARRSSTAREPGGLQVVGRAALSSRHTVYLLRAGGRTLILGAGPQGPPSLLGELPAAGRERPGGEPA